MRFKGFHHADRQTVGLPEGDQPERKSRFFPGAERTSRLFSKATKSLTNKAGASSGKYKAVNPDNEAASLISAMPRAVLESLVLRKFAEGSISLGEIRNAKAHAKARESRSSENVAEPSMGHNWKVLPAELNEKLKPGEYDMLMEDFMVFDTKANGYISVNDYVMNHPNQEEEESYLISLFEALDRDGDHFVSFEEFAAVWIGDGEGEVETELRITLRPTLKDLDAFHPMLNDKKHLSMKQIVSNKRPTISA
uniref:EF-hand domain-containing protein n=1 Tax=Haptolina brevifila TaxID=156173 RepID=A0A7S2E2Q0_9EUKA|mmetsp:Transcript_47432/g.94665  ORF Transcript_47432/g.94665 Transcript_47432/m.94665 type:complete len:252 (+) Transcript_47432:125-880(+)|eukprot:CAMPEP_0174725852 /NCGR_PEP_ID=MMETSP1094-20130205/46550_1 /TAXON_ID=156173 /ORGANISM="Chrysochromulina brevifilum, Strain UTEX LB 985" /LENGTH=251 /DNA_ID=CAMNT_0015927333 /DNA_START=114 /DNA_END=869 /DNA_ORIENTATION=-